MVADWKLEVMCKKLMEEIWSNHKEAILEVEQILKECYQIEKVQRNESAILISRIEKTKQKISNLIDMRTEGDISKEEYRDRKTKLEMEIAEYEKQLKKTAQKETKNTNEELDWDSIRNTLEELIDFSKPKIDDNIVDKFSAKIVPQGNNRFTWYVNLSGKSQEEVDMVVQGNKKNHVIYIDEKRDNKEESEDPESSIHSDNGIIFSYKRSKRGKRYSPEGGQHRLQSLANRTLRLV